ncbi:phosphatase PAP2 family protein [Trujillonella endophytica]|uniref:phosphatase PAP2 family protein n=1 Tax=Trujillonella endophytica TaxID=673521 RepID=UPI000B17E947|nr:phosphatase PAP2 family protein [Trujillella endophytica]
MTDTVAVGGTEVRLDRSDSSHVVGAPEPARLARFLPGLPTLVGLFEFVLLYGLYKFYSSIRNGVGWEDRATAYETGAAILRVQDALFLSWERPLNHWVASSDVLSAVVAVHYQSFHFWLTPLVLIWLYRRRRAHYRVASAIWMGTTFLALIGFYLLPTAPPRLMAGEGFVDVMRETSTWGWWATSGAPGPEMISNQFAAMPSLHCAWAAWCGAVVYLLVRRTWVRVLAVGYPLSTFVVVMATANHYLLDIVAGVALLVLVAGLVVLVDRQLRARREQAAPA